MSDHDPLAEFFARERAQITDLPGGDERWETIATAGRHGRRGRRGRRSWVPYAAGLVAAACAAGVGGYVVRGMLPEQTTVASGATNTLPSVDPSAATGAVSPSAAATSPATDDPRIPSLTASDPPSQGSTPSSAEIWPAPMVRNFELLSMSQAGRRTVFALGTGVCGDHPCRVVVRSTDSGQSWRRVSTIAASDTATGGDLVGSDTSYTQIRMASEQVGWIFGGGIMQTTDGGRTFHAYDHEGTAVVDVATDGTNVAVVSSAGSCADGSCEGPLLAQIAPRDDRAATSTPVSMDVDAVTGAAIQWSNGRALVSPRSTDDAAANFVLTPDGKTSTVDVGCGDETAGRIFGSASSTLLFAACRTMAEDAVATFSFQRSTDAGRTWQPVADSALTLPDTDLVSFAAADDDHLVATAGAGAKDSGALSASTDGGRTWKPLTSPALPAGGWRWVGAPGAGWFYLIPVEGERSFWWGKQYGATWTQQPMN